MDEVKDDLAKPATGVPTQAEQKRIEEQLQAMIDNLAQKKQDKPFAKRRAAAAAAAAASRPRRRCRPTSSCAC